MPRLLKPPDLSLQPSCLPESAMQIQSVAERSLGAVARKNRAEKAQQQQPQQQQSNRSSNKISPSKLRNSQPN